MMQGTGQAVYLQHPCVSGGGPGCTKSTRTLSILPSGAEITLLFRRLQADVVNGMV